MANINTHDQYKTRAVRTFCRTRPEIALDECQSLDAPSAFPQGSHLSIATGTATVNADTSREMCGEWPFEFGY